MLATSSLCAQEAAMSSPPSPVSCVSGSIRHPAEIEEFELQGVKATGRTLGSGSYGSVVEVSDMDSVVSVGYGKYILLRVRPSK